MEDKIAEKRMRVLLKRMPTAEIKGALGGAVMELFFAREAKESGSTETHDEEGLPFPTIEELEWEISELSRELQLRTDYKY